MKKKILSVLLALLMVFGLFAPMATAASTFSITGAPTTMTVGDPTVTLGTSPATAVNWYAPIPAILSVDSAGVVTANAAGTATIWATNTGDSSDYTFVTIQVLPAPSFTFSPTTATVSVGGSVTLVPAVVNYPAATGITWTITNTGTTNATFAATGTTTLSAAATSINPVINVGSNPGDFTVTADLLGTAATATSGTFTVNAVPQVLTITAPAADTTLGFGFSTVPLTAVVTQGGVAVNPQPTITLSTSFAQSSPIGTVPTWNPITRVLTAGTRPGVFTITATSGTLTATRTITIGSAIDVPITTRAAIPVNTSRLLTGSVPGTTLPVTFTLLSSTDNTGLPAATRVPPTVIGNWLNAGNRTGTVTIRASAAGHTPVDFTVTIGSAHTVTFNLNGGTWPTTGLVQSTADTFGQAINAVQVNGTPRRLGFTFVGWWTTPAVGGTQIIGSTPITANTTLWARWAAAGNTTAVPAGSTVRTVFPDANLAARVAASLTSTFNTNISVNTRIFASDLAQVQVLNLTRFTSQPITDLRGIPTLTGVRTVTPANGLVNQSITLPAVARTSPLNHTNVVRNRDGAFVNPTTISNNGAVQTTTPANSTIRWTNVPATVSNLTYTWNVPNVIIGTQSVTFSGTATLPIRGATNFVDVNSNHWFFNAVNFVVNHGYMEGTTTFTFEPNRTLTRAEVAVILYRMAGEPAVSGVPPFTDVTAAWQRNAVIWASRNGIVNGIGGNQFAPNRTVTRQEFAAMLHRFTVHNGVSVTVPGTANLNRFPDRADVSSWAVQYMTWATHRGLITGTSGGRLNPLGTTTRAECAQIIQRYATTIIW